MNYPRIGALLLFFSLAGAGMTLVKTDTFHVTSPDKKTNIRVDTKGTITLSISSNNKEVIGPSSVWMELDQERILGRNASVRSTETRSINEKLTPVVPEKRKVVPNICNELTIRFTQEFGLKVRAYHDGASYRFFTTLPGGWRGSEKQSRLRRIPC